jgi:hypothetical protein
VDKRSISGSLRREWRLKCAIKSDFTGVVQCAVVFEEKDRNLIARSSTSVQGKANLAIAGMRSTAEQGRPIQRPSQHGPLGFRLGINAVLSEVLQLVAAQKGSN